jgi:hypothetical protein
MAQARNLQMLSLYKQLGNFTDTINQGPDALNPELFSGHADRIILGLKAHANTINHARLVALEDTFPRTREAIGEAEFNRISRQYCETEIARASDSNRIGECFGVYLSELNCDPALTDLAQIEWAWLNSYHAPNAFALELSDLGKFSETQLLELPVRVHPAAFVVPLHAPISAALPELVHEANTAAILLTRASVEVCLTVLSELELAIFEWAAKNVSVGNLLTFIIEQGGEDDPLGPILKLIGAGALVKLEHFDEEDTSDL